MRQRYDASAPDEMSPLQTRFANCPKNSVTPLCQCAGMAQVIFHPHWSRTLHEMTSKAAADKPVTLRVPEHLDARIVEQQVSQYVRMIGAGKTIDVIRSHPAGGTAGGTARRPLSVPAAAALSAAPRSAPPVRPPLASSPQAPPRPPSRRPIDPLLARRARVDSLSTA
jgi:rubredoxin